MTIPLFRKVDVKRRGLEVAEQVLSAIRGGDLRAGDRLPSERELVDQTGVSRPSVREALSALHLLGFLETRAGDGTFVSPIARDLAVLSEILTELRTSEALGEALEARRVLEKAMAELIMHRRTPQMDTELSRSLRAMRDAAGRRDFADYSRGNVEFHAAFARATGNMVLEKTTTPLINIMLHSIAQQLRGRKYDSDPDFFDANFGVHEDIYSAITEGKIASVHLAIDRHYDLILRSLEAETRERS